MKDEIRSREELHHAVAVLGASFIGPAQEFVWGDVSREARMSAWAMFQVLGWVAGAEESAFASTLEFVTNRLGEFTRAEQEKSHAS